jgi:acetoin:2,6-dichlorophenolindophenol oxidoreductase subunit beta
MRKLTYIESIAEGLVQSMEHDARVFLMGEGVDGIRGVYGTVLPAYKKFGNKRVIDTPISENAINGISVGAAMLNRHPVVFHQRNDFLLLGSDQLINHAAKIKYFTNEKQTVPLTIITFIARKPGEGAQHSQSLQSLFAHIPGLKVVMPANCADAKGLLTAAIANPDPVLVMYHRSLFELTQEVSNSFFSTPIGKAQVLRKGSDVTIVAVSATVENALEAQQELLKKKIKAEIIDLRSIRPWDEKTILASVQKTGRLLVVDTGWKTFGISAEIVARIAENGIKLKTPPIRITMKETPAPASQYLLNDYHPTTPMIVQAVLRMIP